MARPSTVPTWATDGGAEVVAPEAGQQTAGWATNDILPAGILNWLFKSSGALLDWLKTHAAAVDEDNAWSILQTFLANVALGKSGDQSILKTVAGKLLIGTGINTDCDLVANNTAVARLVAATGLLDMLTHKIKNVGAAAAVGDAVAVADPVFSSVGVTYAAWGTNPRGTIAYWKDPMGFVHLKGYAATDGTVFARVGLPVGYRPHASVQGDWVPMVAISDGEGIGKDSLGAGSLVSDGIYGPGTTGVTNPYWYGDQVVFYAGF